MVNPVSGVAFISHANPEDNDFSRWLSLQLARHGFPVWCDLTRLLGGEDFWSDIEDVIRHGTSKFLYVLSRDSNHKTGTLQELALALSVARQRALSEFVIPLRIDDLPFQDINIQLNRLNAIDFSGSWASGLRQLLDKLDRDGVDQDPRFTPSSVSTWWSRCGSPGYSVSVSPEDYVSNWFAIESMPEVLYLHSVPSFVTFRDLTSLPFPFCQMGSLVVCFAPVDHVNRHLSSGVRVLDSWEVNPLAFLEGVDDEVHIKSGEAKRMLVRLLSRGWWQLARSAGLYERKVGKFSDFYAPLDLLQGNRVNVPREAGGSGSRALVGYRSVGGGDVDKRRRRYWHFAVSVKVALEPFPMYQLIPRIVFSLEGKRAIDNTLGTNRYRKSQGKDWWNAEWRDRTLGLMWWLAGQDSHLLIPLGPEASARISSLPISFQSPVSYQDP